MISLVISEAHQWLRGEMRLFLTFHLGVYELNPFKLLRKKNSLWKVNSCGFSPAEGVTCWIMGTVVSAPSH